MEQITLNKLLSFFDNPPILSYTEIENEIKKNIDKYVTFLYSKVEYSKKDTTSAYGYYKSVGKLLVLVECFGKNKEDYKYYLANMSMTSNYNWLLPDQSKNNEFESLYTNSPYNNLQDPKTNTSVYSSILRSEIRSSEIGNYFKIKAGKFTVNINLKIEQFDHSISASQSLNSFSKKYPELDAVKKAKKLMQKDVDDLKTDEIAKLYKYTGKNKIEIDNIEWTNGKGRNLTRESNTAYNMLMQEKIMKAICQETHITVDDKFYFRKKFINDHIYEVKTRAGYNEENIIVEIPYKFNVETGDLTKYNIYIERNRLPDAIEIIKTCIPDDDPDNEEKILFLELTL